MLTVYSTTWCGYCHRLKTQLDREGIAYEAVDIERDADAADFVMSVNGGNQTVPTVRFADGSALTNPTLSQVKAQLEVVSASEPGRIRNRRRDLSTTGTRATGGRDDPAETFSRRATRSQTAIRAENESVGRRRGDRHRCGRGLSGHGRCKRLASLGDR